MIKKIFYTILIVLTCFIGLNKVSAETTRQYMSYNDALFGIGYIGSLYNSPKKFTNRITYTDIAAEYDNYSTLYTRYSFCSVEDMYSSSSNVDVVNTNIKCSYGNGIIGTLSFFTASWNEIYLVESSISPDNVSTSIYETYFYIYGEEGFGFNLYGVDIGRSLSDFPSYDSNSDVLDELDSLYSSVDTIKGTNNEILYYVMKMYENMVSCRDSYNLFNAKAIGNTAIKVSDDGSIITMPIATSGNGFLATNKKLKELAPNLKVGDVVYLNFSRSNPNYNGYIYLLQSDILWHWKTSKVITQEMLDSNVFLYANNYAAGETEQVIISDFIMVLGTSSKPWEPYGEQICKSKVDETNDAINESNKKLDETNQKLQESQDFMKDDDTSGSSSEAQSFFEGFTTDTYGLTSIITAPLELIGNIAGSTCSPLPLQIPFVGGTFNLPCMSSIYKKHFGSFLTVYQTITFGIVAYWVCIRIFALVKDFKNPEHDEIEVMDL